MNKLIKGSVAAAAGIALLMGGAGSLAMWSDAASINAGTVSSGTLDVSTGTAGTWNQTLAKIVPGDTVVYTETLNLSATGDHLKATVGSNVASITNGITGSTATSSFVVKQGATTINPVAGIYTLNGTYTVVATITVTFPDTVTGITGQNASVNLSTIAVTVTQVA